MKKLTEVEVTLDKIVGGGQALSTLEDGRKLFVWGGLPGERVRVQLTKKKSSYAEGIVTEVITPSQERTSPKDPESYLSTSPWQIMTLASEQRYKTQLIKEAFELHGISLPDAIETYTDGQEYHYRNKVEFSWYGDDSSGKEKLHLAFFRRGSRGKVVVEGSALLPPEMVSLAHDIRDKLENIGATAKQLKTLLIRCDRSKNCVWQLYVRDADFMSRFNLDMSMGGAQGGEVIYSDPRSPASVITERLASIGDTTLKDLVLGVPFRYTAESFFQVNIPVYEQALRDMKQRIEGKVIDLYAGVGSIGLTIGGPGVTLVEINEYAVKEMKGNIATLDIPATAVLAPSERALEYIERDKTIIVDPPRAGLHVDVISRLLEVRPPRIIYLSCNPVTQARDIALLKDAYEIKLYKGYNFFPHTPHIEGLAILDLKS